MNEPQNPDLEQNDPERRRFVRIQNQLQIWFEPIALPLTNTENIPDNNPTDEPPLATQFADLNTQLKSKLTHLQQHSPKTSAALELLNQKINTLFEMLAANIELEEGWIESSANLSACGICFSVKNPLPIGQRLNLKFKINLFHQIINTTSKVIACDLDEAGEGYTLRLDFIDLTSSQEDVIIQYIFQEESAQLRQAKNRADNLL